jgi:DNA topoisomerase I
MSVIADAPEDARAAGLLYVTDQMPGIRRKGAGKGFAYYAPDGSKIADSVTLDRIRSLAIPPAYRDVWICPLPEGHLQATGLDDRGRKQYRYHPRFREVREEAKFHRMVEFGQCLPVMRQRIAQDLRRKGLPREKVLAAVVALLEKSLIRIGNDEYAKSNQSFGLTTMLNQHVDVRGEKIRFDFPGKSNKTHEIELRDRRLATLIGRLQDLPGQELFGYLDDEGRVRDVTSADVNAYIKETSGEEFTAKDFRTWNGTVLALAQLCALEPPTSKRQFQRNVTSVVKAVSRQLGNTPAICRKCYVHPAVVEAYREGRLVPYARRMPAEGPESEMLDCVESVVLDLLRAARKAA